jgi:hypothetical protein
MRVSVLVLCGVLVGASVATAAETKTYTGVVTETMCGKNHAAMKSASDAKCVRDCVGDGSTYKYALFDGKNVYTLSDQASPAKFAGQKVTITGQLYAKTGILRVDRIEPAR